MAWIKSCKELERHPKVLELERLSTLNRNGTIGVLHRFWYWVMDYAEDGNLSKWPIDILSKELGVDVNHLIKAGWIDTKPELRVHDWLEYFGEYYRSKYRKTPEKYEAFKRYYSGTSPVQYRKKNGTDKIRGEEIREEKKRSMRFEKPTASQVTAYAETIGYRLDGEYFVDFYERGGWVYGKSKIPIRDWKACVRTWKKNGYKKDEEGSWTDGLKEATARDKAQAEILIKKRAELLKRGSTELANRPTQGETWDGDGSLKKEEKGSEADQITLAEMTKTPTT